MRSIFVETLVIDPTSGVPVLLLKEEETGFLIPIWIGEGEAMSIALELKGDKFPRPLTHDLIKAVLHSSGSRLKEIIIDDMQDNTYFATLILEDIDGNTFKVDARPSDSVALALRTNSPLYISESVFQASAIEASFDLRTEAKGEFEKFIDEELKLSDFRKYT